MMEILFYYYYLSNLEKKEGIFIENQSNKIIMLKNLIESEDKKIIQQILRDVLQLEIEEIEYDKSIKLNDISEYEFELLKVKVILPTKEEIEMYLKMIKKSKIKESIFCYWCAIYEEELRKVKENENMETFLNKVLISELNKKKYYQSIFLEIENNKTCILETGTEVNFIEIANYINEFKSQKNKYEELFKYFDEKSDDVLLVGIKMKRDKR